MFDTSVFFVPVLSYSNRVANEANNAPMNNQTTKKPTLVREYRTSKIREEVVRVVLCAKRNTDKESRVSTVEVPIRVLLASRVVRVFPCTRKKGRRDERDRHKTKSVVGGAIAVPIGELAATKIA